MHLPENNILYDIKIYRQVDYNNNKQLKFGNVLIFYQQWRLILNLLIVLTWGEKIFVAMWLTNQTFHLLKCNNKNSRCMSFTYHLAVDLTFFLKLHIAILIFWRNGNSICCIIVEYSTDQKFSGIKTNCDNLCSWVCSGKNPAKHWLNSSSYRCWTKSNLSLHPLYNVMLRFWHIVYINTCLCLYTCKIPPGLGALQLWIIL